MNLLSKGTTNAKTIKNSLPTYIMYLAPFTTAGSVNVCPNATEGCTIACLFKAGMGVFSNVINARIAKTKFYLENRTEFCKQLYSELVKINSKGEVTAVRLNGTSDLDFISILKNRIGVNILELSNLRFYDYTKTIGKVIKYQDVPNYTITFSRSETNEEQCKSALSLGTNVAVVFDHRKPLPKTYLGYKVIDGDEADDLMLTNKSVILGLRAKGKAKKDTTGFVVR